MVKEKSSLKLKLCMWISMRKYYIVVKNRAFEDLYNLLTVILLDIFSTLLIINEFS